MKSYIHVDFTKKKMHQCNYASFVKLAPAEVEFLGLPSLSVKLSDGRTWILGGNRTGRYGE